MFPPLLMYLRIGSVDRPRPGVWLPLFLVWLLALPLVLLALALTLTADFFLLMFGQRYHHYTLLLLRVLGLLGELRDVAIHIHDDKTDVDIDFV